MNSELFIFGAPAALVVLAVCTITAVWWRRQALLRVLAEVDGFLEGMRDEHASAPLVRAVREHVAYTQAAGGAEFVLSKPLPAIRREYAEDEIAHAWPFWFGSLLTGVALVATFVLIGIVMTTDVSEAIRGSSDSSNELSSAVATLGSKFYISAAGVAGSVLALVAANRARAMIYRSAEHPDPRLMRVFSSVETEQLKAKIQELELLRAEHETRDRRHSELVGHLIAERDDRRRQHGDLVGYLASLDARAQRLNSIEVSVQAIGNEVSENLRHIMKDAMAEQLREILSNTMAEVSEIATTVQQSLSDSFGAQLHTLTTQLQGSLQALQRAVESQGQGQLEKILEQLQNTVSGGFQAESQRMVAALDAFAKVVPALEQQLRQMTGQVAEETRQRTKESTEAMNLLLDRVSSLMEALGAQQAASAQAIERIQAAAEHGASEMARQLESSGAGIVSYVLGTSRAEIDEIARQLRAAADASAERYADTETRAGHAAAAVTKASEGLSQSARAIQEMANYTAGVLADSKRSSEAIHAASREFLSAGNTLLEAVGSMRDIVQQTRAQTGEQQALLMKQREYTTEVERLWPQMFDIYLNKFKESARSLSETWQAFDVNVRNATNAVGSVFAETTSELSDAVNRLVHATNGKARS